MSIKFSRLEWNREIKYTQIFGNAHHYQETNWKIRQIKMQRIFYTTEIQQKIVFYSSHSTQCLKNFLIF